MKESMCSGGGDKFDLSDFSDFSCTKIGPLRLWDEVAKTVLVVAWSSPPVFGPSDVVSVTHFQENSCINS